MPSVLKLIQDVLDRRGYLLKRKNRWTDVPLSVLPAIVESYSQRLGRTCTALQIGANDGQSNDHLEWCLKYCDMRAILVEPMPAPFELLRQKYANRTNVELDNCAVADTDGTLTLYAFEASGQDSVASSRVSSFSKAHVEAHRGSHATPTTAIVEVPVPAKCFKTLLADHGLSSLDMLLVDTEGMDCTIVKQAIGEVSPDIIYFEHTHVSEEELRDTTRVLVGKGYQLFALSSDVVALKTAAFTVV